jgi:energy-converting hydrogenase A subunit H
MAIIARPERQTDIVFGTDAVYIKEIKPDDLRFQRFMAMPVGVQRLGQCALVISLISLSYRTHRITNIGIVAKREQPIRAERGI